MSIKDMLIREILRYESRQIGRHIQISDDLRRASEAVNRAYASGDDDELLRALEHKLEVYKRYEEYDKSF
ncbi:MAG: hypothetical protein IKS03_03730 [Ruminococcus sp.]|nr:hypothetical protein [Ruminococcus sp.]